MVPVDLDGAGKKLQDAAEPLQKIAEGLSTDQVDVYFTGSSPLAAAGVGQGAKDLARAAHAVGRTLATAGHAVLFSGTTVMVSLAGLWLVRSPKIHSWPWAWWPRSSS